MHVEAIFNAIVGLIAGIILTFSGSTFTPATMPPSVVSETQHPLPSVTVTTQTNQTQSISIFSFAPHAGPVGTGVRIVGQNFFDPSGDTSVTFGTVTEVTGNYIVETTNGREQGITFTVPDVPAGEYAFTVNTSNGTSAPQTFVVTDEGKTCDWNGNGIPSTIYIPDGSSTIAYEYDADTPGTSGYCPSETRMCTNGVLSGSYQYPSCESSETMICNCPEEPVCPAGTKMGHNIPLPVHNHDCRYACSVSCMPNASQ